MGIVQLGAGLLGVEQQGFFECVGGGLVLAALQQELAQVGVVVGPAVAVGGEALGQFELAALCLWGGGLGKGGRAVGRWLWGLKGLNVRGLRLCSSCPSLAKDGCDGQCCCRLGQEAAARCQGACKVAMGLWQVAVGHVW